MERCAASRHGTRLTGTSRRLALVILMVWVGTAASMARPPAAPVHASTEGVITVCPAGPPECAYSTVQAGLDAAAPGDTVLVYPGVYVEQVVLKTGVPLRATAGREVTVITNSTGPIVAAAGVQDAWLQGITIRGQGVISPAIGVDLVDSEVALYNCTVESIVAATEQAAYGVRAEGGTVRIVQGSIREIEGGESSALAQGCYPEWRPGGAAIGVGATRVTLTIQESEVADVLGGLGCGPRRSRYYESPGGDAFGLSVEGGSLVLQNSAVRRVSAQSPWEDTEATAVRTSATSGVYIRQSVIETVRFCSATGVLSTWDTMLFVSDSTIRDTIAPRIYGSAVAISAADTERVVLINNNLIGVEGGIDTVSGGIFVAGARHAVISSNTVGELIGDQWERGWDPDCMWWYAERGTDVVGIQLRDTSQALLTNNVVWRLQGGNSLCRRGGHAIAVDVTGGSVALQGNTLWGTTPGVSLRPDSQEPSLSVGLRFTGIRLLAVNNAIISHTLGVSTIASQRSFTANNDLWHNQVDYADGVMPGQGDLHVDPAFVNPENGDFHLLPFSLLIDAGALSAELTEDFEGDPRPLDGNDDGFALPDIGADEYVPWGYGCALPLVLRTGP